jgi:penicillin-binding protein 2
MKIIRRTIRSDQGTELKRRIYIFSGIPILFFLLILVVLFYLQIVRGPQYALKAKKNREQYAILPAIRGIVYDRTYKTILAYNRRSFAVTVVPQNLPVDLDKRAALLERLGLLLDMQKEEIETILGQKNYSQYGSFVIKTDVPFKDVVFLAEHNREFPGVYWKSKPLRVYPHDDLLAHVIGFVGMISEKEYTELSDRGYNIESVIGKSGVEKVYDLELKGRDGYVKRIVDATNQVEAEIIERGAEPQPGNNVVLTIDRKLQRIVSLQPEKFLLWLPTRALTRIFLSQAATGKSLKSSLWTPENPFSIEQFRHSIQQAPYSSSLFLWRYSSPVKSR